VFYPGLKPFWLAGYQWPEGHCFLPFALSRESPTHDDGAVMNGAPGLGGELGKWVLAIL
jgi:hypothetical protein